MTTTAEPHESLDQAVARRLRGQLAERKISQKRLGELTGWDRGFIHRRMSGETALTVGELHTIESVTEISAVYLMTGGVEVAALADPFRQTRKRRSQNSVNDLKGAAASSTTIKATGSRASSVEQRNQALADYQRGLPLPWLDSNQQPFGLHPTVLNPLPYQELTPLPAQMRSRELQGRGKPCARR